ncbi:arylsulfatase A [Lethenteron reissneri]|uniref:arylsulfatase A n=1 Tax=Lethenteron reissneri TaxID=7753 RepID=UPI002AB60456|nr:arylsulfatase A [Lethenteron reissneri]XP_061420351.1 arylsulfatase A [Lethenteron reissneri]
MDKSRRTAALAAMLPLLMATWVFPRPVLSVSPPNVVIMFADDLGFGDLGCYGHPSSLTPNLDRLATLGLRFTDFYSSAAVCSPSRAGLLTGRYATRSGVFPGVFYPGSVGGLPLNETTIAKMLKLQGYATGMVGKWHLGLGANGTYLPTRHGFDEFLGVPYSHDQGPCQNLTCFPPDVPCYGRCDQGSVLLPLFEGERILRQPVDFTTLVPDYITWAEKFIHKQAADGKPFFLYYASHHTHYPQFSSKNFARRSERGPFGDALLEFDHSVGMLLKALEQAGVEDNTLLLFTSDNGPELKRMNRGGNAGPLKCGKATTYEGGLRVPAIAYWPGKITPGVTHELASTLDLLPTIAAVTGAKLPAVPLDGYDIGPLLFNGAKSPRKSMFYFTSSPTSDQGVFAVRHNYYKAHYFTEGAGASALTPDHDCGIAAGCKKHSPPLLFHLGWDVSERVELNTSLPDLKPVAEDIDRLRDKFQLDMTWGPSQMDRGIDPKLEPCCNPQCSPKPTCCQCV